MKIKDIMKALVKKEISTSMHYDTERDEVYLDLQTDAKSELYLYEDGMLRGRYQYEVQMDLSEDLEEIITHLCFEFNNALHGRDYCQKAWTELCLLKNITLEIY